MAAHAYEDLAHHVGHALECVAYLGKEGRAVNIAVECRDCMEVLLDFDRDD